MRTSTNGKAFLKSNEGFTSIPKNDNGLPSWAYGHRQRPGEVAPESVTEEQGEAILEADLPEYEDAVNRLIPASCTQNQFDALVDFCYNLGPDKFQTMMSHGWDLVPTQMLRWVYSAGAVSPGLEARRQKEVALFTAPDQQPE